MKTGYSADKMRAINNFARKTYSNTKNTVKIDIAPELLKNFTEKCECGAVIFDPEKSSKCAICRKKAFSRFVTDVIPDDNDNFNEFVAI